MTQVLTLMSAKGGTGKTTIARGLLGIADGRGLKMAFLDTDKSGNAYEWARRAHRHGHWNKAIEAYQSLDAQGVHDLIVDIVDNSDLDLLIVDTPGHAVMIHEVLLGLSDLVLCPLNLSAGSIDTAIQTANRHYALRRQVDDVDSISRFRAVINATESKWSWPHREQHLRLQEEFLVGDGKSPPVERMPLMDTRVRRRSAYLEIESKGLLDMIIAAKHARGDTIGFDHFVQARDEMATLFDECLAIMATKPVMEDA